jgi:phosphopantothenate-cysteine ligase
MMHIAITAGGTEESIDGVRKITNMSSGSLGWHCLEAVLFFMRKHNRTDFLVHYIKAPKALTKEVNAEDARCINFVNVTNTQSVYDCIDSLMDEVKIDLFIHAMAISDFSYSYSASIAALAEELYLKFVADNNISKEKIEAILTNPIHKHDADEKISSSEKIIMGFETTPKVIALIKKKNRETFLVGFKLVKNNHDNNLIKQAEKLRMTNDCDAVFANEASQLSEEGHAGLLLYKGEIVARPVGKKQIAEAIVNLAMKHIN